MVGFVLLGWVFFVGGTGKIFFFCVFLFLLFLKEEKSEERNKDMNSNMADRAENYVRLF